MSERGATGGRSPPLQEIAGGGYNPHMSDPLPNRRSIRPWGYDYSLAGAYFVTVCAHERRCLFGRIVDGLPSLGPIGDIVAREWARTAEMRPDVELDAFVVMPNHLHAILLLGQGGSAATSRSLGAIIRGFKAATTRAVVTAGHDLQHPLWQRNYYEHIIRSDESLNAIRAYIADNPAKWAYDRQNPEGRPDKPAAPWQV